MRCTPALPALLVSAVLSIAGCSVAQDLPTLPPASVYAFQQLRTRVEGADSAPALRSLETTLPNQEYLVGASKTPYHASSGLVSGRVEAVTEGRGFTQQGGDGATMEVSLRSEAMRWGYVVLSVKPDRTLGLPPDATVNVAIWLTAGTDIDRFSASLAVSDDVLVVTTTQRLSDGTVLTVPARNSTLLGTVDDAGVVRFPALGDLEAAFVGGLDTVAEIFAAAGTERPAIVG